MTDKTTNIFNCKILLAAKLLNIHMSSITKIFIVFILVCRAFSHHIGEKSFDFEVFQKALIIRETSLEMWTADSDLSDGDVCERCYMFSVQMLFQA